QVVSTCGRKLDRPARTLLAAHVGQVRRRSARTAVAGDELRRLELTAEVRNGFGEMAHPDRLDPGQRRFGARLVGADEPLQADPTRALGDGDDAADAPQAAVQSELSAGRVLCEAVA